MSSKKEEILQLSIKLFATQGYAETTMRDIAGQLDIKASSIYSHYHSKEDLLIAICELGISKLQTVMDEVLKVKGSEQRLKTYIKKHLLGFVVTDPYLIEVYIKYWEIVDPKVERKFSTFNISFWGFVNTLIKDLLPNLKEPSYFIDNSTAVFFILTLNNVRKYVDPAHIDLDQLTEDIFQRFIYGFKGHYYGVK